MREFFRKFAVHAAAVVGSAWAFLVAALLIITWGVSGPLFQYSDTWQLAINTGTTIITFLMVFLIQNTQNRDARVVHLKLDELLRAVAHARTGLVDLEELSDAELDRLQHEFQSIRERANHGHEEAPEAAPAEIEVEQVETEKAGRAASGQRPRRAPKRTD